MDRFRTIVFSLFLMLFAASFINAPYLHHQFLQHFSTVVGIGVFIYFDNRKKISKTSYLLFILYMCFHLLGARYIYSYVPYDRWSNVVLGISISELFGATRNHYDRFVHLLYGLLLTYPAFEIFHRFTSASKRLAKLLAVMFIVASGTLYELGEWVVALTLSPEDAEAYNGQQGDYFDAHKDMVFAFVASIIAIVCIRSESRKSINE